MPAIALASGRGSQQDQAIEQWRSYARPVTNLFKPKMLMTLITAAHRLTCIKVPPGWWDHQLFIKVIPVLFIICWIPAAALSQTISYSAKRATLKQVFAEIKKQTNYDVIYNSRIIDSSMTISVSARKLTLEAFLKEAFTGHPLAFNIVGTTIIVTRKPDRESGTSDENPAGNEGAAIEVNGIVFTGRGRSPLAGVSVVVKRTGKGTQTDAMGKFTLKHAVSGDSITCSMVGYRTVTQGFVTPMYVNMQVAVSELDEAVVQAYGITSKRLTTGSITKVSGDEIRQQPVQNPLMALQGRVPGMLISPTSGNASSPVKVEIRGRNSLNRGFSGEPLYVIDGIPVTVLDLRTGTQYEPGVSSGLVQAGFSSGEGQSPLFGINPYDIESIEVLKDADATAIYGSRGANGVIMITTKKAQTGPTTFNVHVDQAIQLRPRIPNMLSREQYFEVRREALRNDGQTPTAQIAPDLVLWDTNRFVNWYKENLSTGMGTTVSASVSGGESRTRFGLSSRYSSLKPIEKSSGNDETINLGFDASHTTANQQFNFMIIGSYTHTATNIVRFSSINLAPNAPPMHDAKGDPNYAGWEGAFFSNQYPWANSFQPTITKMNNLRGSVQVGYKPVKGIDLNTTLSYSSFNSTNDLFQTIRSQNPLRKPVTGVSSFGSTRGSTVELSSTIAYTRQISKGRFEAKAGFRAQNSITSALWVVGMGYTNDALIGSISNAPVTQTSDDYGQLRFLGLFARVNYNWENKYILNLSLNRDGSSRFAPGKQFGNFGAIGAAWIASDEKWLQQLLPAWVDFIKLNGSYGITGSSNVGDYQYLSQWATRLGSGSSSTLYDYNGTRPFAPIHAVNQQYHWEATSTLNTALNLQLFKNRLSIGVTWYKKITDEQLINLPTPMYTGFKSVTANSVAKVRNTGLEISVDGTIIKTRAFRWTAFFNFSVNRNKLLEYPGLEYSPHASLYQVGHSLNTRWVLHYTGIDPLTGNYSFEDYNKDGTINSGTGLLPGAAGSDNYLTINYDPRFFGGIGTGISYKNFSFSIGGAYQQRYLTNIFLSSSPGKGENVFAPKDGYSNSWRKPGDKARYPRFTTGNLGPIGQSDGGVMDAFFFQINNVGLSWSLPTKLIRKAGLTRCNIGVTTNNIFTISNYKGVDPQLTGITDLPLPRIINANISINF